MLIKCRECGQDLSSEAPVCPHCGKPNTPQIDPNVPKHGTLRATIGIFILVLIFGGIYFSSGDFWTKLFHNTGFFPQAQTTSGHQIPLTEVKNLGYDFYLGQIDSAGANNLTDDFKNQVTKIAFDAHFPINLLKNIPIVILNNLALTGDQYVILSGANLKIPDLKPDFLSEGGLYVTFGNGSAIIFINKPIIAQGQLTEVLTHELGHAIGSKLTDQDWQKYYSLRGIPATTPRSGTSWNLSPQEDFAEVYKNTYTGIAIRTFYGQLVSNLAQGVALGDCMLVYQNAISAYMPKSTDSFGFPSISSSAYSTASAKADFDPKVQACRREVMLNPSAHQSDWVFGTPYKFTASQQVKDFVNNLTTKFLQ